MLAAVPPRLHAEKGYPDDVYSKLSLRLLKLTRHACYIALIVATPCCAVNVSC